MAVGAGWQFPVAILNVICYYGIGLPIGALLGFKFKLGVHGIWWAMLGGSLLQTIALLIIVIRTNWHKQVLRICPNVFMCICFKILVAHEKGSFFTVSSS